MINHTNTTLLERLRAGKILTGMQCFSASPVLVEAMGAGGLDFVTIDMEHCPTGLESLAHLLRAADSSAIVPLARVPELNRATIGRVLDLGAQGIVLPHASPERCKAALDFARYAPLGSRGACPMIRAARYMPSDWSSHASQANARIAIIPLIEDAQAVEDAQSILDIEGIDMVFVGPFDLSLSLGVPGADFRHPTMAAALTKVVEAAQQRDKYVMTTIASTIEQSYASLLIERGVRMMSFSVDVAVFLTACKRIAELGSAPAAPR
jgi:4-hydroxy-2-oxoheptanedioate aldolase